MNERSSDKTKVEIPPTLGESVCAVMGELRRLEKADKNEFARYMFTSVDDFKDAIRPLLAKYGLRVHMNQKKMKMLTVTNDKGKESTSLRFDFEIALEHVSKEKDTPENISIILPYTGAQTTGAARSYALKEWQKSKLLASSGDMQEEADLQDNSREGLRLSKSDARDLHKQLTDGLREAEKSGDHEVVAAWWQDSKERLDVLPKDWFLNIKVAYADAYKALKAQFDLDNMSNAELDQLAQQHNGAVDAIKRQFPGSTVTNEKVGA